MSSTTDGMTEVQLTLRLSPEAREALLAKAQAAGQDVGAIASLFVQRGLAESEVLPLQGEAWKQALDELQQRARARASRYPKGFVLDDSRESIYEGRGE